MPSSLEAVEFALELDFVRAEGAGNGRHVAQLLAQLVVLLLHAPNDVGVTTRTNGSRMIQSSNTKVT